MKTTVKTENTCRCAEAVGDQDPAAVGRATPAGEPRSLSPQHVTLLFPGGLVAQGTPGHLRASVGCEWSTGSQRATWERLGVGRGVGQHLPVAILSFSQLLEVPPVNTAAVQLSPALSSGKRIYLFGERGEWGRGRERGRERFPGRLLTVGAEPEAGLSLLNQEVTTRAGTKGQTLNQLSHPGAPRISFDWRQCFSPFFAHVFGRLPLEAGNLICAVRVSTHAGKFLLDSQAACFLLKQLSVTLHDVFLM